MSPNDSDRLQAIALEISLEDPRFAAALGNGRPRLPREYRRRRAWMLLLLVGAAGMFAASVAIGRVYLVLAAISVAVGALTLAWPDWPDRPRRRWRRRRRPR
jgi:hypothetical protein